MLIYTFRTDLSGKNKKIKRDKLLEYILAQNYGIDISSAGIYKNEYGKPYIEREPHVYFSISHCSDFIAISIAESEHGVDAEKVRDFDYGVAERVFSSGELRMLRNAENKKKSFFLIWTLKESLGKAKGTGLNYDLKGTTFVINDDRITCTDRNFNYASYELEDGYMLSAVTKEKIDDIEIKEVVMVDGELDNVRQSVQKI